MKPEEPSPSASAAELAAYLDSAIERIAREVLGKSPDHLIEAALYSLLGPGKRIRPRLVLAVADAFDLDPEISFPIATALEMTHAYTLIHDDLPAMDNDDFRRGRPTNHKVYGEGTALLAGDSLALLAPDVLLRLRDRLSAERVLTLLAGLLEASGARGVIAGQTMESRLAKIPVENGFAGLFEIFRLKTGALFHAALTLPAIAAGADASTVDQLGLLGDSIGIAFQIADDLEDDFITKKSDPAHVAFYGDAETARREAERRLVLEAGFSERLRENLTPFITELRTKLSGERT